MISGLSTSCISYLVTWFRVSDESRRGLAYGFAMSGIGYNFL